MTWPQSSRRLWPGRDKPRFHHAFVRGDGPMTTQHARLRLPRSSRLGVAAGIAVVAGSMGAARTVLGVGPASGAVTGHRPPGPWFKPGNLVVSRSVYTGTA